MPKPEASEKKLTAQQERDLEIEIAFLEGLVRRDADYVDALRLLGDDYTRRGRYLDGLKVDLRLARLTPADPLTHYNLACSFALTDQVEQAVAELDHALVLGYRDYRWLVRDPDLLKLRQHPLFEKIRRRIKKLKTDPPDLG